MLLIFVRRSALSAILPEKRRVDRGRSVQYLLGTAAGDVIIGDIQSYRLL